MTMVKTEKQEGGAGITRTAVIVACALALFAEAYLVYALNSQENYTSIYLLPDSYSNTLDGDTAKFTYGIEQYGKPSSKYVLDVYIADSLVASKDLVHQSGINEVILKVPEGVMLPVKVRLVLTSDYGTSEVHFYLKDRTGVEPAIK